MSKKVKDINVKNQPYYFFGGIIIIKNFDSNNIKKDKSSYKILFFTILDL